MPNNASVIRHKSLDCTHRDVTSDVKWAWKLMRSATETAVEKQEDVEARPASQRVLILTLLMPMQMQTMNFFRVFTYFYRFESKTDA